MKKNITIINFIIPAILLFTGCKKGFLDKAPTTRITPSSFWKTAEDVKAANIGCYSALWDVTAYVLPYLDALTPNSYCNYPWEGWTNIALSAQTPADLGGMGSLYTGAWGGISACNNFIANVDKVTSMPESDRNTMKGEAYFLRAYYYSLLVNYWGGVPLLIEETNVSQIDKTRSTAAEVYAQVEKDLGNAIGVLPLDASAPGRITKGAAHALLTRVYLYQKKWQPAADEAKKVMDLNKYQLFPNYRAIFLPANENNSEVIFDVQFFAPRFATNWDQLMTIYQDNISPGWSSIEPTQDLINEYELKDGTPYNIADAVANPKNPNNENRDPRMDQTIFRKGTKINNFDYPVTTDGWPGIYTGYTYKKYTIYDNTTNRADAVPAGQSSINGIVIRYADILLMRAEALNEASATPNPEVYTLINKVRARPTVGMPALPAGLNQEQMRQRIRHERRVEFASEGLYYSDVRRWGIAPTVLNRPVPLNGGQKKGVVQVRKFATGRDELMPFPQKDIDNAPNMKGQQNPGY